MRLWRNVTVVLGILFALGGCSPDYNTFLFPPHPPKYDAMYVNQGEFDTQWDNFASRSGAQNGNDNDTAKVFVSAGYRLAEEKCSLFFAKAKELEERNTFWKDTATTASAAAGTVLGLASAPLGVLTGIFGASGLAPKVIDDFNSIFLLSAASDELAGTVIGGMEKFQQDNAVKDFTCSGKADCQSRAVALVRAHANYCTINTLLALVKASVANTCVVDASSPTKSCPGSPTTTESGGSTTTSGGSSGQANANVTGSITSTVTRNTDGSVVTKVQNNTTMTSTTLASTGAKTGQPTTTTHVTMPTLPGISPTPSAIGKSGNLLFLPRTQ